MTGLLRCPTGKHSDDDPLLTILRDHDGDTDDDHDDADDDSNDDDAMTAST